MMRVAVCLLLTFALLLGQWIRTGHCHVPSGEGSHLPHIHLCDCGTADHDEEVAGEHRDAEEPDPEHSPDHEDDAVYLPMSLFFGWVASPDADVEDITFSALLPNAVSSLGFEALTLGFDFRHIPLDVGGSCPVYLRAQTLLL